MEGPKTPEPMDAASPMEIATRDTVKEEAVRSPKLEQMVERLEECKPVDCSCTGSWSLDDNAVMRSETHVEAEANPFSVHGIVGQGNLS